MRIFRTILAAALIAVASAAFAAQPVGVNQLGGSFAAVAPSATGVTTILAAASNTKGCWLRSAHVFMGASGLIELYVDTAAPTGTNDTTKRSILSAVGATGATIFPGPLWLPSGIGIFVATNASATGPYAAATWDCAS